MNRIERFLANRYTLSYAAALLLHLLFFWQYVPLTQILIRPLDSLPARPEAPPVAFEFVETPEQRPSERPPEETPLLSDRQSVARDRQDTPLPPSHLPYSEGLVESKEHLRAAPGMERQRGGNGEGAESREPKEAARHREIPGFDGGIDFASLMEDSRFQTREQREEAVYGRPAIPPRLLLDNRESGALERGGLQLSTYDWDYAPYLSYLKRHIGSHIFPPPAFSEFGMIDGRTRVRFKILRDGTLRDLEVLGYEGSPLLRDTSVGAVRLSADFRPLPDGFPEDYLEITGLFDYIIIRNVGSP